MKTRGGRDDDSTRGAVTGPALVCPDRGTRVAGILPMACSVLGGSRMNVSLYQAAAALDGNVRWQQMVAENLAAASVPGFKKQDVSFSALQAGILGAGSDANVGQKNPSLLPVPGFGTNFKQGELNATGVNKQIALNGPGFLSVQLLDGRTAYTRDGEFHVGPTGQILNKDNLPLIGDGGPIEVDPRGGESISISQSGEVSQGNVIRGKFSVFEFSDTDRKQLERIGSGYYIAKPDAQPVPTTGGTVVMQGFIETSNAVPMVEMGNLLLALRHFEANQRVLQMQDERMGRTIQELSSIS